MAYTKTIFTKDELPAVSATELNKIGDGIYEAAATADYAKDKAISNKAEIDAIPSIINEDVQKAIEARSAAEVAADRAEAVVIPPEATYSITEIDNKIENAIDFVLSFYVDAVNGSDTNTGAIATPFKTLSKAISMCQNGAKNTIYLETDMDYIESGYRTAIGKEITNGYILIRSKDSSKTDPRINLQWTDDSTGTNASIPGFLLINSFMFALDVEIKVSNYTGGLTVSSPCIVQYSSRGSSAIFSSSSIDVGDSAVISDTYVYGGMSLSFSTSKIVTDNGLNTIQIESPASIYIKSGTVIEDSAGVALTAKDIVSGIVYDANGVPRNIISNEIF